MKSLYLIYICIFLSTSSLFAQTTDSIPADYPQVDFGIPPEYPGGTHALLAFLAKNIRYPDDAFRDRIEGQVWIGFIVTEDGSIKDIHIKKGLTVSCNWAAIRAVRRMPKWKPGTLNGKPTAVPYVLPVTFTL